MAGVRRHLLNVLTALLLLLCAAVVALWVRSYWRSDWITHRSMEAYAAQPVTGDPGPLFIVRARDHQFWTGSGNLGLSVGTQEAEMAMPGLTELLLLTAIIAAIVYGIWRFSRRRNTRGFDLMPPKPSNQSERK